MIKWLNPLTWSTLALQIVGGALLVIVLGWYINHKLEAHYNAELKAAIKAASDKADLAISTREVQNAKRQYEALYAKNKQLESNAASAKRAADAAVGLRDDIRASEERAKTILAACLQHASTLSGLFAAVDEFAGRVAQEANGHAADKIACTAAWPQ
jgi:FtsZ-binding cell division protein ZapB